MWGGFDRQRGPSISTPNQLPIHLGVQQQEQLAGQNAELDDRHEGGGPKGLPPEGTGGVRSGAEAGAIELTEGPYGSKYSSVDGHTIINQIPSNTLIKDGINPNLPEPGACGSDESPRGDPALRHIRAGNVQVTGGEVNGSITVANYFDSTHRSGGHNGRNDHSPDLVIRQLNSSEVPSTPNTDETPMGVDEAPRFDDTDEANNLNNNLTSAAQGHHLFGDVRLPNHLSSVGKWRGRLGFRDIRLHFRDAGAQPFIQRMHGTRPARFDGHVLLRRTYVPDFGTPPPNFPW